MDDPSLSLGKLTSLHLIRSLPRQLSFPKSDVAHRGHYTSYPPTTHRRGSVDLPRGTDLETHTHTHWKGQTSDDS